MGLDPSQAAHIAPGGPAEAGGAWFAAVVDRADLAETWAFTDIPLRLALAQSWLVHTGRAATDQDRDGAAETLANVPGSREWTDFAEWRLARWRNGILKPFVDGGWGVVTIPEVVGPDLEFVRIALGGNARELQAGETVLAQTLTVRLIDGAWLVAGIGRTLAVPGWPPTEQELPTHLGPSAQQAPT